MKVTPQELINNKSELFQILEAMDNELETMEREIKRLREEKNRLIYRIEEGRASSGQVDNLYNEIHVLLENVLYPT